LRAVRRLSQVVQRAEQQDCILRGIGLGEFSRIAQCGGKAGGRIGRGRLACLFDVQRDRIQHVYPVSALGKRHGVRTRVQASGQTARARYA
jgi:hypothetical protein